MEQPNTYKIPLIDIRKVIKSKNPRLLKILPNFIINYIKKIIHQDEINSFLKINGDKSGVEFISKSLDVFGVSYKVINKENIPENGKFIFASNHPLGGLDGMVLIHAISNICGDVKFLVNDVLLNVKNLESVFIPINKHGGLAKETVKQIDAAFNSNNQILVFPAGLASRKIKGKIVDLEWKKNFVSKSLQHKRDIIPVHIDGRNSNFFYRLANIRKFLKIKANIEMFYLPDEMFKQKSKLITLTIGKPISYKTFKNNSHKYWAKKIKDEVYSLPKK
ncbi:MAG: 1-acyl-sn-glycerol-3-phosphate acyltransferase [Bacteroidales bacterium]|nr:1-acyl-sn-glycerol-3-phosphate acyltransferase [Bacteroidales bacterium]